MATEVSSLSFDDLSVAFASKSDAQLRKTYWLFAAMNNQSLMKLGTSSMNTALKWHLPISGLIKATIFGQFCGGETIEECEATLNDLGKYNIGTILDYSVEGEKTEAGFDATMHETIATVEKAAKAKHIPFSVFKITGLASFDLLAKMQTKEAKSNDDLQAFERVKARIEAICQRAHDLNVRIFIDAEESWIQDTIDQLTYAMMERFNKKQPIVYNTYQFYRWATLPALQQAVFEAKSKGYQLGAKLVRGAYMEKERARAKANGYADPIQPSKEASDKDFDAAMLFCLEHLETVAFCAGTHNENSSLLLAQEMNKRGIQPNNQRIWFAQLLGMSDNISYNLANAGYNVAKYVPYGPVASVMPYLIRRAQENTSIAGQSSREYMLINREMERRKTK